MDVIALHRAGFGGAVAPLGTALTETQLHELWRLAPEPVLCFDGDTAGERAALRALARALPLLQPGRSLRFAALPPGEDPDSLIRGGGPRRVLADPRGGLSAVRNAVAGRAERRRDRHAGAARRSRTQADDAGRPDRRPLRAERIPPVFSRSPVRFGETGRPARQSAPRSAGRPPSRGPRRRGRRPMSRRRFRRSPGRRNREIVLGIFIAHPALIDEWVEDLAAIEFPEPELDNLRRSILEVAHTGPGLDAQTLRQHLALCGHARDARRSGDRDSQACRLCRWRRRRS